MRQISLGTVVLGAKSWVMVLGLLVLARASCLTAQSVKEAPVVAPKPGVVDTTRRDSTAAIVQQGKRPVRETPNCMRAQPAPLCRVFLLAEDELDLPITTSHASNAAGIPPAADFEVRALAAFGAMVNQGRNGYGAVVTLTSDPHTARAMAFVLEARYRRWISRSFTIDAGLGFEHRSVAGDPTVSDPSAFVRGGNGITALVAVTPERFIGVVARADVVRGGGRTIHSTNLGLRSGWLAEKLLQYGGLLLTH